MEAELWYKADMAFCLDESRTPYLRHPVCGGEANAFPMWHGLRA
jgi:hypothetical protein